jgi:hypothetical protein
MSPVFGTLAFLIHVASIPQPTLVRFQVSEIGRPVTLVIDGQTEHTFAGKLGFQDRDSSWQSVCADVRSPIRKGQFFTVLPVQSATVGGNIAKAGNIVAKYFRFAQTPEQCAGLQIAVWKTIEDGPDSPNFLGGHLRVRADAITMTYALQYYQGADEDGNALFLQSTGGTNAEEMGTAVARAGGQSQLMPN